MFSYSGFPNIKFYRYWDPKKHKLAFDGLIEDLSNAPDNSVVVLHPCAHNPTGCDPTHEQWTKIADLVIVSRIHRDFSCIRCFNLIRVKFSVVNYVITPIT